MKKAAPVMISRLSVNPAVAFRPKLAIRVRAYARAIKVIRFALKARGKFGALYSTSIGFTCFLALITGSASLPACSPCRVAMWKVPPADIECADSGFRISECSVPECPTKWGVTSADKGKLCTGPTAWKATCKKDGREFDCVAYPGERVRCSPR